MSRIKLKVWGKNPMLINNYLVNLESVKLKLKKRLLCGKYLIFEGDGLVSSKLEKQINSWYKTCYKNFDYQMIILESKDEKSS